MVTSYEPLKDKAVAYLVEDKNQASRVAATIASDPVSVQIIGDIIGGGIFRPGQIFSLFDQIGVNLTVSKQYAIDQLFPSLPRLPWPCMEVDTGPIIGNTTSI